MAALLQMSEKLLQRGLSTKHFLRVTKGIERLQQNALDQFPLRASLMIVSFLLKMKTITTCFEQDIFTINQRKVYS